MSAPNNEAGILGEKLIRSFAGRLSRLFLLTVFATGVFSALLLHYGGIAGASSTPTITSVTPLSGSTAGGTPITIAGTNFVDGATVSVGGAACTSVAVTTTAGTLITCTTPSGTPGPQDVVVKNPDAGTATSAGAFTYKITMTLVFSIPAGGPAGGRTVTLPVGGNLSNVSVTWGGTGCDPTLLSCDFPNSLAGYDSTVILSLSGGSLSFGNQTTTWTGSDLLTSVTSWSDGWTSFAGAFYGATSLTSVPTTLPSTVIDLSSMFYDATAFNQDIRSWNTVAVTNMANMFLNASAFNQDISSWNTSAVTNMANMFANDKAFNQDISSWKTAKVTDMSYMFNGARAFNQNISIWDTTKVTTMAGMFDGATAFNNGEQPLATSGNSWNTAHVTNMTFMFAYTRAFNQIISSWDTASVTNMTGMFKGASAFNQDISSWNTVAVTNMSNMFNSATVFNNGEQPLATSVNSWNTVAVTDMSFMFFNASKFNQDISSWDFTKVTIMASMFSGATAFSTTNYDLLLVALNNNAGSLQKSVQLDVDSYYGPTAAMARATLSSTDSWVITDNGYIAPGCWALCGGGGGGGGPLITTPTITAVASSSGSTAGGTSITITGTNFVAGASVSVGGVACTSVVVQSATSITCTTPSGTAGAQNVVVTNSDTGTATSAGAFTYQTPPPASTPSKPSISLLSLSKAAVLIKLTNPVASTTTIISYQYSLNGGAWKTVRFSAQNQATIAHLSSGHTYRVRVRGVNVVGSGASSITKSVQVK